MWHNLSINFTAFFESFYLACMHTLGSLKFSKSLLSLREHV